MVRDGYFGIGDFPRRVPHCHTNLFSSAFRNVVSGLATSAAPAIVWKLPRDMEFGIAVPIGLSREADYFRTIVKVIYEFSRQKIAGSRF
jgi:hypothetical protein